MALKFVRSNIDFLVGPQEPRLATVNTRKLVWVGHVTRQPLQNHPSGHLGRWAAPLSVQEMLDGQHQKVRNGLLQKRLEENPPPPPPPPPPTRQLNRSSDRTELN